MSDLIIDEREVLDRVLTLELVRVTERTAVSAARWRGRGDEIAADGAAVEVMRRELNRLPIDGTVVIGEGERDEVPMLFIGERVGSGTGPKVDIAVDPLEGTTLCAKDMPGSIVVLALARAGALLKAPNVYMEKIAVGPGYPPGIVGLDRSPEDNIRAIAAAKGVRPADITVSVLDRPRHAALIAACRRTGASLRLLTDGDIAAIIVTAQPGEAVVDLHLGSGGAPEGVLASAALRCVGGQMQGRLILDTAEKRERAAALGIVDPAKTYDMAEMASGDVVVVATGVTDGALLHGVRFGGSVIETETVIYRSSSGTVRRIRAEHRDFGKPGSDAMSGQGRVRPHLNRAIPLLVVLFLVVQLLGGCDLDPGRADDVVRADDVGPRRVETSSGPVVGAAAAAGQAFLGIPYAAPPVGPLRWRAPRPPSPWTEPRPATALGPSCLQNLALSAQVGGHGAGPTLGQEDCLTLNVYAPPDATRGGDRPVMVWIHGGAFVLGTSGQYDPGALARREGVIVVTVNYRLGALGFLAHPGLRGEPGEGAFALLDQQAALRWVAANIAGFGGDPRRVTLFGQSAGAWSACYQMASPGAAGLFSRAILESGACGSSETSVPAGIAEAGGARMGEDLGCTGPDALACLRALPADRLAEAAPQRPGVTGPNSWSPATGLDVLPRPPKTAFASGRFNRVPVIDGTNRDEGRLFSYLRGLRADLLTEGSYDAEILRLYGSRAGAVLAAYPASDFASPKAAYAAVLTDGYFACPALAFDRTVGRTVPVYAYEFDDPEPPFALPTLPFSGGAGSYHGSEIAYVFDRPWALADPSHFDAAQERLSAAMQDFWGSFARTGRPEATTAWPRFKGIGEVLRLAPGVLGLSRDVAERHRCAFWDGLGRPG